MSVKGLRRAGRDYMLEDFPVVFFRRGRRGPWIIVRDCLNTDQREWADRHPELFGISFNRLADAADYVRAAGYLDPPAPQPVLPRFSLKRVAKGKYRYTAPTGESVFVERDEDRGIGWIAHCPGRYRIRESSLFSVRCYLAEAHSS